MEMLIKGIAIAFILLIAFIICIAFKILSYVEDIYYIEKRKEFYRKRNGGYKNAKYDRQNDR